MMKRYLLSLALLALLSLGGTAHAATCYWVGGSGNYDNSNTASWSGSSGGSGGTCAATGGIPKNAADTAVFDGSSGGGTVTVCGASAANCPSSPGNLAITQITFGAFASGTLDFATNNPNVALTGGLSGTGTATRTFNMGTGTWTLGWGGVWNFITTTGLAPSVSGASIVLGGIGTPQTATQFFSGGLITWGPITFSANTLTSYYQFEPGGGSNGTYASWTINAPANIQLRAALTQTVTGAITVSGSSASAPVLFTSDSSSATVATVHLTTASTCDWCAFRGIVGNTSAWTATNSFNFGTNASGTTGTLTISGPSGGGGGGGHIIGG